MNNVIKVNAVSRRLGVAAWVTSSIFLAGCGGSSSDTQSVSQPGTQVPATPFEERIINASSYTEYTYFNLDSGSVVPLTDADAASSDAWHIAFRRNQMKLNGGASGPGAVAGALAAEANAFYDGDGVAVANVFLNATPDAYETELLADYAMDSLSFVQDEQRSAIQGPESITGTQMDMGWYLYDLATHQISVNPETWWLIRSAAGDSYARFHATELTYDRSAGLAATFVFDVQPAGASQFIEQATFQAGIPAAGGAHCFDMDGGTPVDCAADGWDLKLEVTGRNWRLWTNGGISGGGQGGAFGPFTTEEAQAYVAGDLSPAGASIVSHYAQDHHAGLFAAHSWYAYNLAGGHKLWPNYRVYMIDTNRADATAPKYRLQVTNYYSDAGVSGHPNIRYLAQ